MKYYVWINHTPSSKVKTNWIRCKKAAESPKGWLEYELKDGTIGLSQPGKWKKQ